MPTGANARYRRALTGLNLRSEVLFCYSTVLILEGPLECSHTFTCIHTCVCLMQVFWKPLVCWVNNQGQGSLQQSTIPNLFGHTTHPHFCSIKSSQLNWNWTWLNNFRSMQCSCLVLYHFNLLLFASQKNWACYILVFDSINDPCNSCIQKTSKVWPENINRSKIWNFNSEPGTIQFFSFMQKNICSLSSVILSYSNHTTRNAKFNFRRQILRQTKAQI